MKDYDKVKLLHGPYKPPKLRKGERATCLYRDRVVVITSWSVARISWPRCRAIEHRGPGSGLLVCEELARAVRTESAAAVMYWWGVSVSTVWLWRQALGVSMWGTEGSKRLLRRTIAASVAVTKGKKVPRARVRRAVATRRAKGNYPMNRWLKDGWKKDQLALLGTMPDEVLAKKIGRTSNAVRVKRTRLGIPNPKGGALGPPLTHGR